MSNPTMLWAQSMLGRTLKAQYRLDGILGEGAMGVVFRGVNISMDKPVAIKMMRKETFDTPDAVERFNREARVWSQLNHPVITQVFDFGVQDGQPFIVMELVDGVDLSDVIKTEGTIEPLRAVQMMRQLASALEEAHRLGVVHRDIKPQNMKLLRYKPGGKMVLKVLDFGMAKQVGRAEQKLTAPGMLVGTPKYVAPEQLTENPVIDGRVDLYAAGVLFYEMLTGSAPFVGTPHEVLFAHLGTPPKPLPETVPQLVADVVMRLLRKRPDERFSHAAALENALEECETALRSPQAYSSGGYVPVVSPSGMIYVPAAATSGPHALGGAGLRGLASSFASGGQPALGGHPAAAAGPLTSGAQPVTSGPSAAGTGPSQGRISQQAIPVQSTAASSPAGAPAAGAGSTPGRISQQAIPVQSAVVSSSASATPSVTSQGAISDSALRPPTAPLNRAFSGGIFLGVMVLSAVLFYGLRHSLPLQRALAGWLPATMYKVPQDETVQAKIRSLEALRDARQWQSVVSGAQELQAQFGATLLPDQVTVLVALQQKGAYELPMQELYERLVAAATRPDPDEVLRLHAQLHADSIYRALSQGYYDAAVEQYVTAHVAQAEQLRLSGRCQEFLAEIQRVLGTVPGHAQVRGVEKRECPPAVLVAPAAAVGVDGGAASGL